MIKYIKPVVALLIVILLGFIISTFIFSPKLEVTSISYSKVFYDNNRVLLGAKLSKDDKWRFETEFKKISPALITALIEFEDKRFFKHLGVDPGALIRAFWSNITSGRIVSGGSTLTMQTARLIWKTHRYGKWIGKLFQIFRAIQLEVHFSKQEILKLYFNLAPYGKNIEGVTAASWFYYGKPPSSLNWTEAVHLAIAPKSPNRYRLDRFPQKAQNLCRDLVSRLQYKNKLNAKDTLFLSCRSDHARLRKLPHYAQHLVDRLVTNSGIISSLVQQPDIQHNRQFNHIETTIDLKVQLQLEDILKNYLLQFGSFKPQFASILAIDNSSHSVIAYIGSADFDDKTRLGEVDGIRAFRSPGSTLKPFLYAKALESGRYSSKTLLTNVPLSYLGFRPENYNKDDLGITHFDEALQHSLNIPAVDINVKLSKENDLYAFLEKAAVSSLKYTRQQYGHSIVLGGVDIRLDELATLFTILAHDGVLNPLKMVKTISGKSSSVQLLKPESSYIISDILRKIPIPKYMTSSSAFESFPDIAWKTGTSSRKKDVWSIGYNKNFTIGVWLGDGVNVDREFSGRNVASPLLFNVFRYLNQYRSNVWPPKPENVILKKVCRLSGQVPTHSCEGEQSALWIAGVTKAKFCDVHRKIYVEKKSGKRLSTECIHDMKLHTGDYFEQQVIIWPQETGSWLSRRKSTRILPPYKEGCIPASELNANPPRLHTPLDGETYAVEKTRNDKKKSGVDFSKIVFNVSVTNTVNQIYWFIDDEHKVTTKPGEIYVWDAEPGAHVLVVMDDLGRTSRANFNVILK